MIELEMRKGFKYSLRVEHKCSSVTAKFSLFLCEQGLVFLFLGIVMYGFQATLNQLREVLWHTDDRNLNFHCGFVNLDIVFLVFWPVNNVFMASWEYGRALTEKGFWVFSAGVMNCVLIIVLTLLIMAECFRMFGPDYWLACLYILCVLYYTSQFMW